MIHRNLSLLWVELCQNGGVGVMPGICFSLGFRETRMIITVLLFLSRCRGTKLLFVYLGGYEKSVCAGIEIEIQIGN